MHDMIPAVLEIAGTCFIFYSIFAGIQMYLAGPPSTVLLRFVLRDNQQELQWIIAHVYTTDDLKEKLEQMNPRLKRAYEGRDVQIMCHSLMLRLGGNTWAVAFNTEDVNRVALNPEWKHRSIV